MFYEREPEKALRFGDVLKGYPSTTPMIEEPILNGVGRKYNVNISIPNYCVVMDPCCSIGNKMISLTPLIQVFTTFFDNPYLAEDLTRINRVMKPEQAVPPAVWEKLPEEEKRKRLAEGDAYAFVSLFVYEKHDLFPRYTVHRRKGQRIETNYYMIDFRNTYKLSCDKIHSPTNAPLHSKVLQLSVKTRSELRDKVTFYFARIPQEDKIRME